MQNWEQHIETVLSDMRTTEVPFGIEQRIIAHLSMKRVIHLVRASVGERDRFITRGRRTSRCWSVASFVAGALVGAFYRSRYTDGRKNDIEVVH
jgi:hypothetical protein